MTKTCRENLNMKIIDENYFHNASFQKSISNMILMSIFDKEFGGPFNWLNFFGQFQELAQKKIYLSLSIMKIYFLFFNTHQIQVLMENEQTYKHTHKHTHTQTNVHTHRCKTDKHIITTHKRTSIHTRIHKHIWETDKHTSTHVHKRAYTHTRYNLRHLNANMECAFMKIIFVQ